MKQIYLDYNATFPIRPHILETLLQKRQMHGNPSSIHSFGRKARQKIEATRHKLAQKFSLPSDRVIFTSGGTEANNMVLRGFFNDHPTSRLVISSVEHPSVLASANQIFGQNVSLFPIDREGKINLDALDAFLYKIDAPVLLSVMYANNETGIIQQIAKISEIARKNKVLFHCDIIQAFGKIPLDFGDDLPDFITLSGHKIGAFPGVGALITKHKFPYEALILGGGQERGFRSGTENVLGIESLGLALDCIDADIEKREQIADLRDCLERELEQICSDILIFGKNQERLPNTSAFAVKGLKSEAQVISLDLEGFAISAGSACSSGKTKRSHVICAMGTEEEFANAAIRISIGPDTTAQDIDQFIKAWKKHYELNRK